MPAAAAPVWIQYLSKARWCVTLLVIGFSIGACGPIYVHDPAGETAATMARTNFQEALTKARLSDLVGTFRAQNAEQTAATRALADDDVRTQMFGLSAKQWSTLLSDTDNEIKDTSTDKVEAEAQLPKREEALTSALQSHKEASTTVNSLVEGLNAAATSELRHAASQKLLAAALETALQRTGGAPMSSATLEDVLMATVNGRDFKLDENNQLKECPRETTVGEVLKIKGSITAAILEGDPVKTLQGVMKNAQELTRFKDLQLDNPGIAVTIIGLGYDIARAAERRAAAAIDEARRTHALYRAQIAYLKEQENRLKRNRTHLQSLNDEFSKLSPPLTLTEATVEDLVRGLRAKLVQTKKDEQRNNLRNTLITLYQQLGDNLQYRVIDAKARAYFDNALSVVQTERVLAQTEINLREREAIILRGLDGLVAFHQGGIDSSDVRNLIMLAQAFSVFAIAAK